MTAFNPRQRLALDACTSCGQCVDVCPAVSVTKDGNLSALVRMRGLKDILHSRCVVTRFFRNMLGKKEIPDEYLKKFGESVYRCSLCGNCQEVCPVGLRLSGLWLSLREDIARSGHAPEKIAMINDNLDSSHNVFDEDNDERADWVDDMRDPPDDALKESAEVVFFTGCVGAYFPLAQKIPQAMLVILESAGVSYSLLGKDEWCCGFPLLGAGLPGNLQSFIDHNVAAVRARGARSVIFTCPSCRQIWHEAYPPEFKMFHASEFVLDLLQQGRLTLTKAPYSTVTYHDPCDLGRGGRVFDAPREILRAIPGLTLKEMGHNREHCLCCGGGGNLEMIDPELSTMMAKRKVEEAMLTGAQAIVTSCQQCVRTMTTYARRNKVEIDVLDVMQLVEKAM
ncbi:MAG: (Fe-S)-binding protein [Desulfovibrio sp.]|jgi:heterodisulfide reductase subunit D|nr:(Fe-S)-binding protein [Desulfovibrio sp.]